MVNLFKIVEDEYSNSLVKQLNLNTEKELEKLESGSLLSIGSTYNVPSTYTVYDIVSSIVVYALAEYLNKSFTLAKSGEDGLKFQQFNEETIKDIKDSLLEFYENFLKNEKKLYKKLKKDLFSNMENYRNLVREINFKQLIPSNASQTMKAIAEGYKCLFGDKELEEKIKRSGISLIYKTLFGDIKVYGSKALKNNEKIVFPLKVKRYNSEKDVDNPIIEKYALLDFIITNYLLKSKEIPIDLREVIKAYTNLDLKAVRNLFQSEVNFSENISKFIPLGNNLYILLFSTLKESNLPQLSITNYSNPKDTAKTFKRVREIYGDKVAAVPGVRVYLINDGNLKKINSLYLKDLQKEGLSLEKILNQSEDIIKQTKDILKTKEFYEHYVVPIIIKK